MQNSCRTHAGNSNQFFLLIQFLVFRFCSGSNARGVDAELQPPGDFKVILFLGQKSDVHPGRSEKSRRASFPEAISRILPNLSTHPLPPILSLTPKRHPRSRWPLSIWDSRSLELSGRFGSCFFGTLCVTMAILLPLATRHYCRGLINHCHLRRLVDID